LSWEKLSQGRANPGRGVGFRENQVGLSGEGNLNTSHGDACFDSMLAFASTHA
jgi:hypothetical protein